MLKFLISIGVLWIMFQETVATDFSDKIDSLTQLLKTENPENKSRIYNLLAWNLRNNDVKLSLEYATNAYQLALEYNDAKNLTFSLNTLGLLSTFKNKHEEALEYFNQGIKIAVANKLENAEANAYVNIGNIYYQQSQFDMALEYYKKASLKYEELGRPKSLARSQVNIGLIHFERGNYSVALDYYFQVLKIYQEESGFLIGKGPLLNNIGDVYYHLHNYEKAYVFYKESIAVNYALNDQRRLCTSYLMASKTTCQTKMYRESQQLIDSAILIAGNLEDQNLELECLISKANTSIAENKIGTAAEALIKGERILHEVKNHVLLSEYYLTKSAFLIKKNDFVEAEKALRVSLKEACPTKSANLIARITRALFSVNMQLENYKIASENAVVFLMYSDSLVNENVLQVINTQQKYEEEKVNKALLSYQFENERLTNDAFTNKVWLFVIIGLMIAMLAFSSLWYFYIASEKKSMKLINNINKEIHQQKIINLSKIHELEYIKARLDGEEKERTRIAKELHDGIGGMLGVIRLELTSIDQSNFSAFTSVIEMLDNTYEEVRNISHDLSTEMIRKKTFAKLIKSYLSDFEKAAGLTVNLILYPEEKINELNEVLKIDIYRIYQELLSNVVRHSKASEVTLQLIVHDDYINLLLEDNGMGFEVTEDCVGIGLINIKSRIKKMCGSINIESVIGNGTTVNIDIPYKSDL